ncbi:MAG: N-glycosylase/DNA lyase [Candidatus Hydrothermia bacterium]
MRNIEILMVLYKQHKLNIEERVKQFEATKFADEKTILKEFLFCLLTPQSKAKVCWNSVEKAFEYGLLEDSDLSKWRVVLSGVRFPESKLKYIMYNLNKIETESIDLVDLVRNNDDSKLKREFLIKTFKGMGMKEASHFLRNTGHLDLAILDRHILRNMLEFNVVDKLPKSLTKQKYLELEQKLKEFSKNIDIPFAHLDMLLWAKETREVFK